MRAVCRTLGLEFDPVVLDPYEGDRMREGPKGARAIGDPNMAGRGRIQKKLASSWLSSFDHRTVDPSIIDHRPGGRSMLRMLKHLAEERSRHRTCLAQRVC